MESGIPSRPYHLCRSRGLSDGIWHLIEHCWDRDPRQRPLASQIVKYLRALINWPVYQRLAVPSILPTLPPAKTLHHAAKKPSNPSANSAPHPTRYCALGYNIPAQHPSPATDMLDRAWDAVRYRASNCISGTSQDDQVPTEVAKNWSSQPHAARNLINVFEGLAKLPDELGHAGWKHGPKKSGQEPGMKSQFTSKDARPKHLASNNSADVGADLYSKSSRSFETVPPYPPPDYTPLPSSHQTLANFFKRLLPVSQAIVLSNSEPHDLGENHAKNQRKTRSKNERCLE